MLIYPLDIHFYPRYVYGEAQVRHPIKRHRGDAMNQQIPANPSQRWEWLKYQLRSQGSSLRKLSDELGVTDNAVQLAKYTPYPRMERAIAKKLGFTPQAIWPERWNHDGTPCRERPNRAEKLSTKLTTAKAQNRLCDKDSGSNANAHRQMAQGA
tara:strand:+ start:327 stop:788 length:462 start_codon:yes stop_codon:yes gene_type:complete